VAGLADRPGLRVCHGPAWTPQANLAFLEALARHPVALASPPPARAAGLPATFFSWEWGWLGLLGRALPPPGWEAWAASSDPLLAALDRHPRAFLRGLRDRAQAGDTRVPAFGPVVARMAWTLGRVDDALAKEGLDLLRGGTPYAPTLRFALAFASRLDALAREVEPGLPVVFGPKVRGELDSLLDLFPHVIAFPTFDPLSRQALVGLRPLPAHPLGLALAPRFLDGDRRSPLEAFLHDLDHARYKVREDLLHRGIEVPDPYRAPPGGGPAVTVEDPAAGRHRTVLDKVDPGEAALLLPQVGDRWEGRLEVALGAWRPELRDAARLLRFELHHEKSLPCDPARIAREATNPVHLAKLDAKLASGFLDDTPCDPAWLEPAAAALTRLVRSLAS
jgi:hypothetical protein